MNKLILGVVALMALTFVACEDNDDPTMMTVGFEDVTLNTAGLAQNDSVSGSIKSGDLAVTCTWATSWGYTMPSGFAVSNQTDTTNAGYMNPYSSIAQSGAKGSSTYAVYNSSADSIKFDTPVNMEDVMLCNNAYAYVSMLKGDLFAKKFEAGDYFKLILTLYGDDNISLGSEDFYLADFRDGNSLIIKEWTKLDLSTFKGVSYIKFNFESTDTGDYGMNTPSYFCIDNISYYVAE